MKAKLIIGLTFCLFCSLGIANSYGHVFVHDSPHDVETHHQANMANERWDRFQDEIRWFLEYTNSAKKFSRKNQDNYLEEKWSQEYEVFAQDLTYAQSEFLKFREKVARSFASNYGEDQYAPFIYTLVELELTKLYTEYIEQKLFPVNWKELYEQSLKEKNNNKSNEKEVQVK